MIEIGNTVVHPDLIRTHFTCDLNACHGACCVHGDSGAPLEVDEIKILEEIYPVVREYLSEQSVKTIGTLGTWVIDIEDDKVTPLNNGKECAYTVFEGGIAICGIEKAYNDGKITFRKPVSCHLYPVRISKYKHFDAVNYDRWEICNPALIKGDHLKMPAYLFTREALERKYGINWFQELITEAKKINNDIF
jgi:hypothetical protein